MSKKIVKIIHRDSGAALGTVTLAEGITPEDFGNAIGTGSATAEVDGKKVDIDSSKAIPVEHGEPGLKEVPKDKKK